MVENTRTESFWLTHVNEAKKSGLSTSQYCVNAGIRPHQFYYWKSRLLKTTSQEKKANDPGPFISVTSSQAFGCTIKIPGLGEVVLEKMPPASWVSELILSLGHGHAQH